MRAAIYLRTSTEEQNPENQKKDCIELAQRLRIKDYEVFEEQKSAFKDNVERPIFNKILEDIRKGRLNALIVWDYDRLFRNRIKTVEFIRNYSKLGLKVFSYRQQWFEEIAKIPPPWNEMMNDLLLQVVAWMAEEESRKKSERVKLAVRKNGKEPTTSYRGNKWGRPKTHTNKIKVIKELRRQGLNYRQIKEKTGLSVGKISAILSSKKEGRN